MFEQYTYEYLMTRALARVPNSVDKREGSIIYDALAPACVEFAQMYVQADVILDETFADTASRPYLIKRAKEQGLTPVPAKGAILKGVFNIDIPIGERFSLGDLTYISTEKISAGVFKMTCETLGTSGNEKLGTLIPIQGVSGLTSAELTELLVLGEDEEDTEVFRARYNSKVQVEAFGGNKKDYLERIGKVQGVGGLKVYPAFYGGGTVKVVFIDTYFNKPITGTVDFVQEEVDPLANTGEGLGVAPIGHKVTVLGVDETTVNFTFSIVYNSGFSWSSIQNKVQEMIDAYFLEKRKKWADSYYLVVRISELELRLLEIEGVADVTSIQINGISSNLTLEADAIPKRGAISG